MWHYEFFGLIFGHRSTIIYIDGVAQWQERAVHTRVVQGSTPCTVTTFFLSIFPLKQVFPVKFRGFDSVALIQSTDYLHIILVAPFYHQANLLRLYLGGV